MVAAYECDIVRKRGIIRLKRTTFWITPDKDPRGAMMIEFKAAARKMGSYITHDALSDACHETTGDVSILIGFSPTVEQAQTAMEQHLLHGGRGLLMAPNESNGHTPRALRAASLVTRVAKTTALECLHPEHN